MSTSPGLAPAARARLSCGEAHARGRRGLRRAYPGDRASAPCVVSWRARSHGVRASRWSSYPCRSLGAGQYDYERLAHPAPALQPGTGAASELRPKRCDLISHVSDPTRRRAPVQSADWPRAGLDALILCRPPLVVTTILTGWSPAAAIHATRINVSHITGAAAIIAILAFGSRGGQERCNQDQCYCGQSPTNDVPHHFLL